MGKLVPGVNDLATVNPELAKEWHPTKNGALMPHNVAGGSHKKAWWLGKCGHEWQAIIGDRNNGNGCPLCCRKKQMETRSQNQITMKGSLQENTPEIAAQWHSIKNGELTPQKVTSGSNKKVWWICEKGHEWEAVVSSRALNGNGCPYCAGLKAILGETDLATTHPKLVKEWHPSKNGELTPTQVTGGSSRKVWWICEHGHEWQASISERKNGTGCPVCANKKALLGYNDLATLCPELAAEWHPTKNGELMPSDVTTGSDKKAWWQCKKGHEWQAAIASRSKGIGCPYCSGRNAIVGVNDLATLNPELIEEWHPTKNGGLLPSNVKQNAGKKVWWRCSKGHEWKAAIASRTSGSGCPVCFQSQRTSFPEKAIFYYMQHSFPDTIANVKKDILPWLGFKELDIYIPSLRLAVEYDGPFHSSNRDQQKNEICLQNDVTLVRVRVPELENNLEGSVNFMLQDKSEESLCSILKQIYQFISEKYQISICFDIDIERDRFKIIELLQLQADQNSLSLNYPSIASEWHPTKNGELKAEQVSSGADTKVWWLGKCGHEWQASISNRTNGTGCPICAGKITLLGFNDLQSINPSVAAEWHPTKNGELTPKDVTVRSGKKYWWLCEKGHEWKTSVNARTGGTGCPICAGRLVLPGYNDLATYLPEIAKEWHPTKNGSLLPSQVTKSSHKKIWWKCSTCGHEWESAIANRSGGKGCPMCGRKTMIENRRKNSKKDSLGF